MMEAFKKQSRIKTRTVHAVSVVVLVAVSVPVVPVNVHYVHA